MKKLFLLVLLITNISCYANDKSDVSVVVISSLERVLQDEVDVRGESNAHVYIAKGETESFQIIVSNPTNEKLADIDLQGFLWHYDKNEPGRDAPRLELFREHYVEIKRSSGPEKKIIKERLRKGMYPDALIPFVNPYTGKEIKTAKYLASGQDVQARHSQGYWIDIHVSKDVNAGVYTNIIAVFSAGRQIAIIPIKVTVWNFALPEKHKHKTYFGNIRSIDKYHKVKWNDPVRKIIIKRYEQMLRDHAISPIFSVHPKVNISTGQVIFTRDYIRQLKAFSDEMHPTVMEVIVPYGSFKNDPGKRARCLQSWQKFIEQTPWLPEPFIYLIADVATIEGREKVTDWGKAVNSYAPDIKLLVTDDTWYKESNFSDIDDMVDIWVPLWIRISPKYLHKHRKGGADIWSFGALWYDTTPSWLLDFPILNYRMTAWSSWCLDLKGMLYWQTMAWSKNKVLIDPWTNCETYGYNGKIFNGSGSLLYPGKEAGIDGPVSSMRLKVFRDSVEDFDYFSILSKLVDRAEVDKIVARVASSFRDYSRDHEDYIEARIKIAKIIEEKISP